MIKARYVHTNLTARDWKRLARFYCDVFGCVPKPPERDLSGDWFDRLTAIDGARLRGIHLLLPGFAGADGPTLEIFTYDATNPRPAPMVNDTGYGHLAFSVDDVAAAFAAVQAAGGSAVGECVVTEIAGVGTLHVAYARDPEGNIVELQRFFPRA